MGVYRHDPEIRFETFNEFRGTTERTCAGANLYCVTVRFYSGRSYPWVERVF